MNLAQMGQRYETDKQGRTKLVSMKPKEQEDAMKNNKRAFAAARWEAKQRKLQKAA